MDRGDANAKDDGFNVDDARQELDKHDRSGSGGLWEEIGMFKLQEWQRVVGQASNSCRFTLKIRSLIGCNWRTLVLFHAQSL